MINVFNSGNEIYYRSNNTLSFPEKISPTNRIYQFYNKLLHPEDKLKRKPILKWIAEINYSLMAITSKKDLINQIENAAIIYNQATYIMAVLGDFQNAYKFCNHAILLFDHIFNNSKEEGHLFYAFQPWINLIRLDKICANESAALTNLEYLIHPKQASSIYEEIIVKALQLNPPKYILEIINNAYVFEKLKIFLQFKRYPEISILKKHSNINNFHLSVIAESEIIAFNDLREFDTSFSIAVNEYKNGQAIAMPVFLYRIMELATKEQSIKYNFVETMIKYIRRKLNTSNYSLYDLFFMYEVYKYIFVHFDEYKDIELLLLFSSSFLQEDDEPGRIDCLRLISLLDERYSDALNNLVQTSSYQHTFGEGNLTRQPLDYSEMLEKLELFLSYHIKS